MLRRQVNLRWLPAALLAGITLIVGCRLIYLSQQTHAAEARLKAGAAAAASVQKIEIPLRKLAEQAVKQAAFASRALSEESSASLESVPLAANTFWMTATDRVLSARQTETDVANGIAGEWQSSESLRPVPTATTLGPTRVGSRWIIATRFPVVLHRSDAMDASAGWSVAYADMERLAAAGRLAALVDAGYDFQLTQVEPRSARSRVVIGSEPEPLANAVNVRIRLPNAAAIPDSYLEISVRPKSGWYPSTLLVSEISLLVFMAWLLAFGVHDLGHALQRSRDVLSGARRRMHSLNQQLATEMQKRLDLQETFDHARYHDVFTGLPNRRYFMDQLDKALREVRAKRRQRLAVVIIDIARFKLVNDMLGHTAGDELMLQAARRFEKATADFECVLARWGGDQFALLIQDVITPDIAVQVAGLLRESLRAPFELRRHRLVVAATVGITLVDSGQQRAEDIVREADIALSAAKREESENTVVYLPSMAGQAANLVSLEADLHVAMERRELRLLFQPIVDLHSYRMVGAEALLRWNHPVEGMLTPDKFLRIAEDAGLMIPITRWIILRVAKLAAEWLRRVPETPFFISINLSATVLRDPGLGEFVASLLRDTGLPPSLLKFELAEAALISNVAAGRETLERLRALGVQLMLDDFGTGYSSLSYLQLFPFDFVKIDRPFSSGTDSDQANTGMMAAMVQMAGSLRLTAVAEIVETEAAANALRELGCELGQGYYFSEPIEVESALQQLRSQRPLQRLQPVAEAATTDSAPDASRPRQYAGNRGLPLPAVASATPAATSATVKVQTLEEEDDSPTILVPAQRLGYSGSEGEG